VAVETQDIVVETGKHVVQFCNLHSSVLPSADGERGGAGQSSQTDLLAEFAAERDSPGRARHLVVAALQRWGLDEALVGDAALVLSELSTNAVVHAGSRFTVAVRVEDSTLRIAVQDARPLAETTSGQGEPMASGQGGLIPRMGHGLGLIEKISTRWGVESVPGGKVVWAELPYEPT
jgi:anti-sigma regulatory factor (Ser/Thr protein kinase)